MAVLQPGLCVLVENPEDRISCEIAHIMLMFFKAKYDLSQFFRVLMDIQLSN